VLQYSLLQKSESERDSNNMLKSDLKIDQGLREFEIANSVVLKMLSTHLKKRGNSCISQIILREQHVDIENRAAPSRLPRLTSAS